jgi:hypothetical protein
MRHFDGLRAFLVRVAGSTFLVAAILGLGLGPAFTTASDLAGQLDEACASDCKNRGYDAEHCDTTCWVTPGARLPTSGVSPQCMTECRERGGKAADCLPLCRVR